METILKDPVQILHTLNEYQVKELKEFERMQAEINPFLKCTLFAEIEIYENKEYFRYFQILANYKGHEFKIHHREKTGFRFYLTINFPFVDYIDFRTFVKENPEPNNIFKLSEKKIQISMEHEIKKFNFGKNASEIKKTEIEKKLKEINNLFPGNDYSFFNRFKEIIIEKNGLTYLAKLHDSGYIEEKISLAHSNQTLNKFYDLTK
jgi:hypothetical protein